MSLQVIDAFICQHGSTEGGDYFLEEYSFAEVATTPFLHRGAVALSAHRGYDVQKAVQLLKLQRFGAWMQVCSYPLEITLVKSTQAAWST